MNKPSQLLALVLIGAAPVIAASQAPDAAGLLRASMDCYHNLRSFSANSEGTLHVPAALGANAPKSLNKVIEYQAPNLFSVKVIAAGQGTAKFTSDGNKMLIYITSQGQDAPMAMTDKAPDQVWSASSVFMSNPMLSSVVLQMMQGSAGIDALVDSSKGTISAGGEESLPGGQKALHIKFFAKTAMLGHTDLLIGEDSKLLYAASFDMAGIAPPGTKGDQLSFTETFSNVQTNQTIAAADFSTSPPAGVKVQDMAAMAAAQEPQYQPPVPIGKPAPDIKVFSLVDGMPMKLSSLKGKVVMIDFWATWCPPCRESLPHTQDLYKKYRSGNVRVLTVSDEDAATIRKFLKEQSYTFPAFRDPGSNSEKLYGINAIPTVAIIDASGNLSAFFVGLQNEDILEQALKKAGAH